MANDEEMFVLFEDIERQRRRKQFYQGQNPFINLTENYFKKTFSFNKKFSRKCDKYCGTFYSSTNPLFGYGRTQ
jgi:hypothetical protein